jgi:integrase
MTRKRQAIHNSHTQLPTDDEMPQHIFKPASGSVYYVRRRVPTDLVAQLGRKEIRKSLGTAELRDAKRKAPYALAAIQATFDEARKKLSVMQHVAQPLSLTSLPDGEIYRIVSSWFIREESKNEELRIQAAELPPSELDNVWDNITSSITDIGPESGTTDNPYQWDFEQITDGILKEEGISLAKESLAFAKLKSFIRRASKEATRRQLERFRELGCGPKGLSKADEFFAELSWSTPPPSPVASATLGQLLKAFEDHYTRTSSPGTARTYQIPVRLLRQHFSDARPLSAITPPEMQELFTLLENLPLNAHQRYPGKTIREAIDAAQKCGDVERLGKKTLANYYNNIVTIFNFGVDMKLMADNPAKSRVHRDRFKHRTGKKAVFSVDELNVLFRAPLFTGCENDEHGYAKAGASRPRRGRFWIPLLALFQGMRCNEICQLFTEDLKEEEGVAFIWVRRDLDNSSNEEKHLKTDGSERRVPIHSSIIKMGFLDYLKQRQEDRAQARLFPELSADTKGYYSGPFSKWYGRFQASVLPECEATFHSFRHVWRTALRRANVSIEDAEELGGWTNGKKSSESHYNHGQMLPALKLAIDRLEYPGLNIGHLFQPPKRQG